MQNDKDNSKRSVDGGGFSLSSGEAHKSTKAIYWSFVLFFSVFLGVLVFFSSENPGSLSASLGDFFNLQDVYAEYGIDRFLEEKNNLKAKVMQSLKEPANPQAKKASESIAVYLFPEVLPEHHFEKEAAMLLWAPRFKAIEKKPKTKQARELYEEAKAEIWNYENPSRKNPKLSDQAKQTLKIYKELSTP